MRNLAEKSLKRFIKRKITFTLGMMVAFLITGSLGYAADFVKEEALLNINNRTEDINREEYTLDTKFDAYKSAMLITNNGKLNLNSKVININYFLSNQTNDTGWRRCAVNVKNGGELSLKGETININSKTDNDIAVGVHAWRDGGADGNINGGKIRITADNLNIKATSDNSFAYGIYVYNNTTPASINSGEKAEVVIDAKNLVIDVKGKEEGYSNGIIAWSEGNVKINNGNVKIDADNAINTRGNSLVEINKENDTSNIVQIDGDIVFEYDGISSGTTVDSDVIINLNNANSFLNGNITITGNPTGENAKVDGMNLGLSNGAQWTTDSDSFVNKLTMNNGIINNGVTGNIVIDKLLGTGGTINAEAKLNTDGTLSTGDITIKKVKSGNKPNLDIVYKGVTADNLDSDDLDELVGHTKVESGTITGTGKIEEGLINGEIVGNVKIGQGGSLEIVSVLPQKPSTTVDGLTNIAAINFLTWRQEMGSLNQRMGELRDTQGTSGVWARVYGGEFELDGSYKNKYQTYQVGYDKNYDYAGGKLFLGYLFSYTDGSTDYDLGSGDNSSFGAGVYGTWLNNSGHYIDVIAKINRLHNEYDIYSKGGIQSKGDYTNYGISLSAEYGKRFTLDRVFIEPSVRMDLGKIGHESYTTSSGVRVDQDRMYTAQGSLGAKLGYKLDKGNIYARLSGVKEFAGDVDMKYQLGNTSNTHREDFEDEWIEFGVGGNYRVAENVNLYLDLSRTTDATVDTNWQANLGFRYEF